MKTTACSTVAAEKHDEPRQRLRHDELRADDAGEKADDRLGEPADADDPARDERVLDQAGGRPAQQPGDRARRQCHVDDDDEHQIDGDRSANDVPSERGLQREGERRSPAIDPGDLHSRAPRAGRRARASASGRRGRPRALEKSTAGRHHDPLVRQARSSRPSRPGRRRILSGRCRRCPT